MQPFRTVALVSLLLTASPGHAADDAEDRAAAAIKALGGRVVEDPDQPGRPVTHVDLAGVENVRDGLTRLPALKRLQHLGLRGTTVTDADLALLKPLATLEAVDLSRTAITDNGLEQLKHLNRLQWVTLSDTRITDRAAELLKDCP